MEHRYRVEYMPHNIEFTLTSRGECKESEIIEFVKYLVADTPSLEVAISKSGDFFTSEALNLDGYCEPELDDNLIFVQAS